MRALRFDRFGDPQVLRVAEVPTPVPRDDEAVIAVRSSTVNQSDLLNVAGSMEQTTLPRTPGRDFAGVVVDGPPDWAGVEVWGTGGDVGFTRDGSHAELLVVPAASLARKPERLSFEEASTVGVNFVTGWLGAVEAAQLDKGETVAVFGISGGVGAAVAQIAHALGANVIGVGRKRPADDTPAASIVDDFVTLGGDPRETGTEIRRLTGGTGADVVYDAVGGVTTPAALASLAVGGRLVAISAIGTRTIEIDLIDLYRNEIRIFGCNSLHYDLIESGARLQRLAPFFESGQFRPMPVVDRYTLDDGEGAYRAAANQAPGRVAIRP